MDKIFFEQTFRISNTTNTPIYEQLLAYFRHIIQTGEIKSGEQLITENAICETLGISRTTVRQAMNQLCEEGLVVRHRGRGSFVADKKLHRPINYLYNFTENMHEMGIQANSIVLSATVDFVDSHVRTKLNLPLTQEKVFHLTRLRCANNEPILLEDTYIPYYLCEGIEKVDFSNHSLYQILEEHYSLSLYHATETIEAIIISNAEAELLQCKPKIAGYRITRTSHLNTGYVFEYTTSTTRSDRCMFQLELYKNPKETSNQPLDFQRSVKL